MKGICGADCETCEYGKNSNCKGCVESKGCPFGKQCFIAEYIKTNGVEQYEAYKKQLIDEFNGLDIPGMMKITELYTLNGAFVNLAYPLPNGENIKFLDDKAIYLGAQSACALNGGNSEKCFGLVAGLDFMLVLEYGANCESPEIIIFKKR